MASDRECSQKLLFLRLKGNQTVRGQQAKLCEIATAPAHISGRAGSCYRMRKAGSGRAKARDQSFATSRLIMAHSPCSL